MRSRIVFCLVLGLAATSSAKEPKQYQRAKLLQMDSVPCGIGGKDSSGLTGEMPGVDSSSEKTQGVFCQEYILQADHVIYHIRPRDQKHPVLLPIGTDAQFRLEKNKMLLRMEDFDRKERDYVVVSMTPRADGNTADAMPVHLNHLQ